MWWSKRKKPVAVFRCETGDTAGGGHFFRSLALSEAWVAHGGKSLIWPTGKLDVAILTNPAHQVVETGMSDELLTRGLRAHEADWCVLDGYGIDPSFQKEVKEHSRCLVIDDDGCHGQYYADVVLNPGVTADVVPYQRHADTKLWLGPAFSLVRGAIRAQRSMTRVLSQKPRRILVAMGLGIHARDALVPIVQLLDQARRDQDADWQVRVVVGPALADEMKGIDRFSGVELVENSPQQFPSWLVESDLLISAGGVTAVEAAYLGTPMLLFPQAPNQDWTTQAWISRGVTLPADMADLPELLARWNVREWAALAQAGQELVDGQGADRVVANMREMMGLDEEDYPLIEDQ